MQLANRALLGARLRNRAIVQSCNRALVQRSARGVESRRQREEKCNDEEFQHLFLAKFGQSQKRIHADQLSLRELWSE